MVDYNNFIAGIERIAPGGVLIHSDMMRGLPIVFEKGGKEKFIIDHYVALVDLFAEVPLFMPAFNYDFPVSKRFDVRNSPSQVGVLAEYFRKNIAVFRTKDPVFSFCGNKPTCYRDPVVPQALVDPFGRESFFQHLYDTDGLLFHYGTELKHSTVLHFIERKLGSVAYRYDKTFEGCVADGGEEAWIRYLYHVRPKGRHLDYAWDRLENDLTQAGIFVRYKNGKTDLSYAGVRAMTDFLVMKQENDPFYLLDEESASWVIPTIRRLNRNLEIHDFE